jgi:uncharacterized glyoxalase superfamily protein PhnB
VTASLSVTSAVEVGVDPATAFAVFTQEIDCWWVQGPINFYDSSRAYGRRIEPGVGGRIVEVYDSAASDGLELARITVWEPGVRLAWQSSLDDVEIDVRFDPSADGTVVRVNATVPEGGADRGETSWVRVTPLWFGDWISKRDRVPHEPLRLARLAIAVQYSRPATAAQWLRDVFGFEPASNIPETDDGDEHAWIEFHVGNCALMVLKQTEEPAEGTPVTHTPWVFVDDLDAHYSQAKERGARILTEIWQHGVRAYEAADLEEKRWTFAQASPRMR